MQVGVGDSWREDFLQDIVITLTIVGEFHDRGTVQGGADIGDVMEYAMTVGNAGSVTLTDSGKSNCNWLDIVPEAFGEIVSRPFKTCVLLDVGRISASKSRNRTNLHQGMHCFSAIDG